MAKLETTAQDIRNMSTEEWNEYRKKSWLKKRAYYEKDMPDYYLPNQNSFANYLEKLQEKIERKSKK